jgi:hypothetical protein
LGRLTFRAPHRGQIFQTGQAKAPQEHVRGAESHRSAGQIETACLFNEPLFQQARLTGGGITPRTCSMKARETGWL